MCSDLGQVEKSLIGMVQEGSDQLTDILTDQHHQPSGSNWSGIYMFVGNKQFTSPHLVGVSVSAKWLEDIVLCLL